MHIKLKEQMNTICTWRTSSWANDLAIYKLTREIFEIKNDRTSYRICPSGRCWWPSSVIWTMRAYSLKTPFKQNLQSVNSLKNVIKNVKNSSFFSKWTLNVYNSFNMNFKSENHLEFVLKNVNSFFKMNFKV